MLCVKQKHKHESTLFDFEVTAVKHCFQSIALKTGANGDEVPPVPIPNTEVKLISVENTWLATAWEDRAVPVLKTPAANAAGVFLVKVAFLQVKCSADVWRQDGRLAVH